jgi:hypothetical protein
MVNSTTSTLADRLAARKVSNTTPATQYELSTDRYHLLVDVRTAMESLSVAGLTSVVQQYFDALDAVRITLKTTEETLSIKVAIKRAQEYISARNSAIKEQEAGDGTPETAQDIKDFNAVVVEIQDALKPYSVNCSHNANKLEGLWYYGDLKNVDDADVDALLPKKRVRK